MKQKGLPYSGSLSQLLTGETNILLRIETDYRWVHVFNELSAHESPSTLSMNNECPLDFMTLNIDKVRVCVRFK